MVPEKLIKVFRKLRPDLMDGEFSEDMCYEILNGILDKKVSADGRMTDMEKNLTARVSLLQEELKLSLGAGEDIKALKSKATHIMNQFTRQREHTHIANAECAAVVKRQEMLMAHIEKLMKCLRMEAAAKIKLSEANRRERQLTFKVTAKVAEKDAIIIQQKKLIMEMKEGSYVLEGQLRLMDDRFYEMRQKLDTARANQKTVVERAAKQVKELRKKFGVIHGPRHALDDVVVPELPPFRDQENRDVNTNAGGNFNNTGIITEFDYAGSGGGFGYAERSMVGGDVYVPPGKIRPGTTSALRQLQGTNDDPHASLRDNIKLRRELKKAKRPSTAPQKRPQTAGAGSRNNKDGADKAKKGSVAFGFHASGDDKADVDKIIARIHKKHSQNSASWWTPDALADLVRDETGKVTCPIPDLRPQGHVSSSQQYESDRLAQLAGQSN